MSQDGFGIRTLSLDPDTGDAVDVLSFAASLAAIPGFASATAERVTRLARVRHPMYARVRKVDRPSPHALLLYSDHIPGWRLSDVLTHVEREGWRLDISTVLALMRQLLPAVALFSRHQRDATIGTIGPERLLLTPDGRLVIAEYVLAPGLERAQYSRDRLWRELRVAMPPVASPSRVPPSADIVGLGIVALSLLLGRLLRDDEYLVSLGDLCDGLTESSGDTTRPLSATFGTWLAGTLQFDGQPFETTQEAQVAFEQMLARERSYVTSSAQLHQFVAAYERVAGDPPTPTPLSRPVAPSTPSASASVNVDVPAREVVTSPAPSLAAPAVALVTPHIPVAPAAPAAPVAAAAPVAPAAPVGLAAPEAPAAPEALAAFVAAAAPEAPAAPEEPVAPAASEASAASAVTEVLEAPAAPAAPAAPEAPEAPAAPDEPEVPEAPEVLEAPEAPAAPEKPWRKYAVQILATLAVLEALVIAGLLGRGEPVLLDRGELVVQSRPVAARVSIDGEERGITPFTTELTAGSHVLEVRVGRSEPRVIPLMIRPGVQTGLYVELQSVATVGGLEVRSDPPKARVTVGGQERGVTPLVVSDLPPGEVEVVIRLGGREVRQTVRIEPGITSQLVVPLGR